MFSDDFLNVALSGLSVLGGASFLAWWGTNVLDSSRGELNRNPAVRKDVADKLREHRWAQVYEDALNSGLRALDRWAGEPNEILRGFTWCWMIALVYPLLALLLCWWLFGISASIGNVDLLPSPESLPTWQRGLIAQLSITGGIFQAIILRKWKDIAIFISAKTDSYNSKPRFRLRFLFLLFQFVSITLFIHVTFSVPLSYPVTFSTVYVVTALIVYRIGPNFVSSILDMPNNKKEDYHISGDGLTAVAFIECIILACIITAIKLGLPIGIAVAGVVIAATVGMEHAQAATRLLFYSASFAISLFLFSIFLFTWVYFQGDGSGGWIQQSPVGDETAAALAMADSSVSPSPDLSAVLFVISVGFGLVIARMILKYVSSIFEEFGFILGVAAVSGCFSVALFSVLVSWVIGLPITNDFTTSLILFLVILSMLNASFDCCSWYFSRRLGCHLLFLIRLDQSEKRESRKNDSVMIYSTPFFEFVRDSKFFHGVLDVAIAVGLLLGLAVVLPLAIRGWNWFLFLGGQPPSLDLDVYLCSAASDPLGKGLWVVAMLVSTLLPTMIHLSFLLGSPFIARLRPNSILVARADYIEGLAPIPEFDLRGETKLRRRFWVESVGTECSDPHDPEYLRPLHPETTRMVTRELWLNRPLIYMTAFLVACAIALCFVELWSLSSWSPLPQIFLWFANGFDWAAVQTCFSVQ